MTVTQGPTPRPSKRLIMTLGLLQHQVAELADAQDRDLAVIDRQRENIETVYRRFGRVEKLAGVVEDAFQVLAPNEGDLGEGILLMDKGRWEPFTTALAVLLTELNIRPADVNEQATVQPELPFEE